MLVTPILLFLFFFEVQLCASWCQLLSCWRGLQKNLQPRWLNSLYMNDWLTQGGLSAAPDSLTHFPLPKATGPQSGVSGPASWASLGPCENCKSLDASPDLTASATYRGRPSNWCFRSLLVAQIPRGGMRNTDVVSLLPFYYSHVHLSPPPSSPLSNLVIFQRVSPPHLPATDPHLHQHVLPLVH